MLLHDASLKPPLGINNWFKLIWTYTVIFDCYSISQLTNLKVLEMSFNDFSAGLPDIISSLLSLEKLELTYCKLQTLPKR